MKRIPLSFDSVRKYAESVGVGLIEDNGVFILLSTDNADMATFSDLRSVVQELDKKLQLAQKLSYIF